MSTGLKLNSNILAQNATRQLSKASQGVTASLERLATGLRINKAADDAAGLSVVDGLNLNRRVYNQGIRNLNDGLSALNIADGALGEMSNVIIRIKELAEQGANGTLGNNQRNSLQKEVTELQSEYNRILRSTSFNNSTILTGQGSLFTLQGGFGTEMSLAVQIGLSAINDQGEAGIITKIEDANGGTNGNLQSQMSSDGNYVVFRSDVPNLVSGVTGQQIYLKNLITGQLQLASSSSNGLAADGATTQAASVSADGRYVAFRSDSTNLVSGASGMQIYVKDMLTGELKLASSNAQGQAHNGTYSGQNYNLDISHDGRFLAFTSDATNLISGISSNQTYLKDLWSGEIKLASSTSSGTAVTSTGNVSEATVSADGRYVMFRSNATTLISGVSGNQIYLKDMQTNQLSLISADSNGTAGNNTSFQGIISDDGRYAFFTSLSTNLITGVSGSQLYRKNLVTGELALVSSSESGSTGNGTSNRPSVSADGRYVAFASTSTNLVGGASGSQVYIKDMETGKLRLVSKSDSGSLGDDISQVPSISANGLKVSFDSSSSNLVTGDTNGLRDVFIKDLSMVGVQEMSGMAVAYQAVARNTLTIASKYLEDIAFYRGSIGSSMSRINSFTSVLQSKSLELSGAASRIQDANIPEDSAQVVASKILQQAATAVLASAKNQPQLAIRLLKDL